MTRSEEAKREILSGIRTSLARKGADGDARARIAARIDSPTANVIPRRAQVDRAQKIAMFVDLIQAQDVTCARAKSWPLVAKTIADYLATRPSPSKIKVSTDPAFDRAGFEGEPRLVVERGLAVSTDLVTISRAMCGIAETGTLMFASDKDAPPSLNFVGETHGVVLDLDTIVSTLEDAFGLLRARFGKRIMPRSINLVSGTSCTADIGMVTVRGAHGPRKVHLILVGE
jgi:L-lactate dehydrogenase complex protein LldG